MRKGNAGSTLPFYERFMFAIPNLNIHDLGNYPRQSSDARTAATLVDINYTRLQTSGNNQDEITRTYH
jgi:hypothetical protein